MSDQFVTGISGEGSTMNSGIKDSNAQTVDELRRDFNALLAQLRSRKII